MRRIAAAYRFVAVTLLSTVLIFFALFALYDLLHALHLGPMFTKNMRPETFAKLAKPGYPGWSEDDLADLYREFPSNFRPSFSNYILSAEKPVRSRYVSISPEGFRFGTRPNVSLRDPGPKVCLFGASTVFGVYVGDRDTIGAYLQRRLDADPAHKGLTVFNLGHRANILKQSAVAFYTLATEGVHCDYAVFQMGMLEERPVPWVSRPLSELADRFITRDVSPGDLAWVIGQTGLLKHLRSAFVNDGDEDIDKDAASVLHRYLTTRDTIRALARGLGTRTLFVIEPNNGYRCRVCAGSPLATLWVLDHDANARLRRVMTAMVATADGRATIDLTGLFETWTVMPYNDGIHFTPPANKAIADRIYEALFSGDGAEGRP